MRRHHVLTAVMVAAALVLLATHAGRSSQAAANGGRTIDGIPCQSSEQLLFHVHAHLSVFDHRRPVTIPAGVGIERSCIYWLHSHTPDGVIHIESPVRRAFTLGEYLDIWGRRLPRHNVVAYVDGHRRKGNPRRIRLTAHRVIQLDIAGRVAPRPFTFPPGL